MAYLLKLKHQKAYMIEKSIIQSFKWQAMCKFGVQKIFFFSRYSACIVKCNSKTSASSKSVFLRYFRVKRNCTLTNSNRIWKSSASKIPFNATELYIKVHFFHWSAGKEQEPEAIFLGKRPTLCGTRFLSPNCWSFLMSFLFSKPDVW